MKKKNILVVDNSHLMVELMRNLLEGEGHYVVTAGDGLEALDILKTFVPEVIFIDLVMPSIDGKKLCQIIQRMPKLKDSYRVIVSAIAAEDPLDAAALGAHALIAKGKFSEIAEHVLAAVEQSEQRRPEENREVMRFETVAPREITRELLSANKHFELILERMAEGIIEITAGGRIVYANPIALAIIGLSEETLLGMQFCDVFAEGDRQRIKELVMRRRAVPLTISEEAPLTLKQRTVTVTALPAEGDGDATTIMIINDITDRKRAEDELQKHHEHLEELVVERTAELKQSNERLQKEIVERKRTEELLKASLRDKEVLLREVNHRTKNNMQIISSLFSLQSARCKDQKVLAIMQDSQDRIRAMALIHETLYQAKQFDSINFGEYVGQLVHDLYAAYRISSDRIHLQIDIQDVSLGIDTAAPCGLVINELVSNSLKHAFPPGTSGAIMISATSGADDVIDLNISDDGIGMPSDLNIRETETVGLQLVFGIVEDQLNGTLEPLCSGGTGFRIRFRGLQGKERM